MAAIDYHHGDMDIDEQKKTFHRFVRITVWGSALTVLTLLFLTLHFTFVGLGWFPSLGVTLVVGVLLGLGLQMKGSWYAALIGLTVFMGVIGVAVALVSALAG